MRKIASKNDPEQPKDKHFIAIDMKKLNDVIDNMINKGKHLITVFTLHIGTP